MPPELLAVEELVRAVVDHDDERLALLARDREDLYFWTRDYGGQGDVELVVAPGTAEEWGIDSEAVVSAKAAKGRDFVERLLDTDPGARRVGELGVGTNAALRTMTGDLLIDGEGSRLVHIALGRAYPECGGVNGSAIHWDLVRDLRGGGSFCCDDVGLVRDGVIQDPLSSAAVARS